MKRKIPFNYHCSFMPWKFWNIDVVTTLYKILIYVSVSTKMFEINYWNISLRFFFSFLNIGTFKFGLKTSLVWLCTEKKCLMKGLAPLGEWFKASVLYLYQKTVKSAENMKLLQSYNYSNLQPFVTSTWITVNSSNFGSAFNCVYF